MNLTAPTTVGRRRRLELAALFVATLIPPATAQLTHRFAVGEQLSYSRNVTRVRDATPTTDIITLTCLARDATGMRLLVTIGAAPERDGATLGARDAVVLTIDETGRRTLPPETPARLMAIDALLDVLPALPLAARGETDWITPADPIGRRWRCTQTGRASAAGILTFTFTEDYPGPMAEIVGLRRRGQFTFNPQAGHVVQLDVETVDAGGITIRTDSTNLGSRATMPAEWTLRRNDEATRFLRTLSHAERLMRELDTAAAEPAIVVQKLEQLWLAFGKELDEKSGSPFLRIAEAQRDAVIQSRRVLADRAALGNRWMNKPAVGWTLETPEGASVTSERTRRGVTIECFWGSDSPAAVQTVDALRALRRSLVPPDAIGILCYNIDSDATRSRRAARAIGADPPQFVAGPLAIGDPLPVTPTVRVLDQRGVVRGIWVGWQPDYSDVAKLASDLAARGK